ncbi:hypothetical protein [Natrialba sp. INN-245]|uniref:hypothetical protein n=1 Tax=Natrialba sp. INN-245 TaxID=2690967 RepID=UPI0013135719|nr:hypothetical protein [Natrialba sp. INN-245]MWV41663.1 hypothetical protein [Natrialba sp. INN-245]
MVSDSSLSLTEQIVLLALVRSERDGEAPIQTHDLRRQCDRCLERVDTDVVGSPKEADVVRSLYRLEDDGVVEEIEMTGTSPTGKGRPAYAVADPPETVLETVDDDIVDSVFG